MKKLCTTLLFVLLTISAQAQRQSTVAQLLNNSTATGRVVPAPNDLIGAAAHKWLYCTTATSLQVIAEESPDNVSGHFVPVSPIYGVPTNTINGNQCAEIQVGGLAAYPAFNVLAISGGNISAWYLGSTGAISTFPPAANSRGATTPTQCDQSVAISTATGTDGLLIGSSAQSFYLCAAQYSFSQVTTNGTLQLIAGTGTNCAVTTAVLWTNFITASTPQVFNPFGMGSSTSFRVPPGQNICVVNSGVTAGSVLVDLSFAQY
jgi:hypothetical protein